MLDQIDLDRSIKKRDYKQRLPDLQQHLYALEQTLLEARIPTLIIFEGWATTSKINAIGVLMRRLDPRGVRVHSITPPRTHEMQYPWLHRFWLKTPGYGQMAIFDRSWYRQVLTQRTRKQLTTAEWHRYCEDIVTFERQIASDGAVLLKFWLHISQQEQRNRLRRLEANRLTAWQVTDDDHWQNRHYRRVNDAMEDLMARTDTPYAPWIVLPATNTHYAHLTALETIVNRLQARLGVQANPSLASGASLEYNGCSFRRELMAAQDDAAAHRVKDYALTLPSPAPITDTAVARLPAPGILRRVDLTRKLEDKKYDRKLVRLQARLHLLGYQVYRQKRPVVLVFEGWDAAGKGGAIQRITETIDPRSYTVHSISAPTGEDRVHHYLYRFWRRLPERGTIAIFDRSWYGRVLVERIEGFAHTNEWQRAYAEINEFERQLIAFGTIMCKFWLHISPEEQLRRFEERQSVPYKTWKLTEEDWRNREKWDAYEQATDEMLLRTSTLAAPWTIIEAEDKRFARIKVLRTVVKRLEADLGKVRL